MTIHHPLPRVPTWIMLQTHGDRPHFWTLPPGRYLERTEGRYGCPHEMAAPGRRYLAGEIDRAAAEVEFADALAGFRGRPRRRWEDAAVTDGGPRCVWARPGRGARR